SIHSASSPLQLPPFPTRRSSDLALAPRRILHLDVAGREQALTEGVAVADGLLLRIPRHDAGHAPRPLGHGPALVRHPGETHTIGDRKSTRLNSSHVKISYAVFCL